MKNKRNINTAVNKGFAATQSSIQILGNSECILDSLYSVVEYNKEKIVVDVGKYYVSFFGDELYIDSFSHDGAVVRGNIISLEFSQYD